MSVTEISNQGYYIHADEIIPGGVTLHWKTAKTGRAGSKGHGPSRLRTSPQLIPTLYSFLVRGGFKSGLHLGPWFSILAFGANSLRLGICLQGRDEHFLFICAVLSNLLILKGRQQQRRCEASTPTRGRAELGRTDRRLAQRANTHCSSYA